MSDERRRHVRLSVDLAAELEIDGERIAGHLSDMSPGGALVDTDEKFEFGAKVIVHITIPGQKKPLAIDSIVRWSRPNGLGIQFNALGVRDTYAITEFLAKVPKS